MSLKERSPLYQLAWATATLSVLFATFGVDRNGSSPFFRMVWVIVWVFASFVSGFLMGSLGVRDRIMDECLRELKGKKK